MKQRVKSLLWIALLSLLAFSCRTGNDSDSMAPLPEPTAEKRLIPMEDALALLSEFLKSSEKDIPPTRSGAPRKIASVSTYFRGDDHIATKAASETGDNLPSAYLVNFEDGEGFAVLGANSSVADIVAVTESGQIEDDLTVILSTNDEPLEDIDQDDYPIDTIGYYCKEDDDFYSSLDSEARFISECIRNGVEEEYDDKDHDDGGMPPEGEELSAGVTRFTIKMPLLNTTWGQDPPYNKYCYRWNKVGKKKSALTGCSTTAMAMIVTHNEYPQNLIVNGDTLNWSGMKSKPFAYLLSDKGEDDVARLMGSIYYFVNKVAEASFTLITPEQIKRRMQDFNYTNVVKHSASDFTYSMKKATSDMLANNKPVFISALPKKFWKGHSWVIDGAKYSSTDSYNYLLHFNFGWSGKANGYFSTTCLNPSKAEGYDDPSLDNTSERYSYRWHFRLITYDVPSGTSYKTINYAY